MKITVIPTVIDEHTFQIVERADFDDVGERYAAIVAATTVDLRDKAIRECLIALGWTPPPDQP